MLKEIDLGKFMDDDDHMMMMMILIVSSYAIPLYLQALDLAGLKTCHATVLMNNLSDSYAALGKLDDAKQWAQRGLDLAQNPNTRKANKDGEVCDETCGILLFNMGMLLEVNIYNKDGLKDVH